MSTESGEVEDSVTAMVNRPQMLVEEFEEIARHSGENVRLEFVGGKLGVKAMPDGDHAEILRRLTQAFALRRPDLWLYSEKGLQVETHREGRARADGALAPVGAFAGHGDWAKPEPVLLVVEITSYDNDTDRRDRVEKPRAYAEAGIAVYLLIDRDSCEVFVYSKPVNGVYSMSVRLPFGSTVELPAPVGMTLDTEPLQAWVR
jgi:Uma2 family endonuclease